MTGTTPWRDRCGRSTSTSRSEQGASLYVSRMKGAIKHRIERPWEWSVSMSDDFPGTHRVEVRGACATESEAQAAADGACPRVLRAYAELQAPISKAAS